MTEPNERKHSTNIRKFKSRERDDERPTRKPLAYWDRIKILLLLIGAWLVLLWSTIASFPTGYLPLGDALNMTVRSYGWLLALALVEFLRQVHYFISEHSASYHRFWTRKVFGSFDRRVARMNDWNRFRISRVLKIVFFLIILDLVIAELMNLPVATALFQLPTLIISGLPLILQLGFAFFFVILQFVGLFWFLSRGGVDVYFPDDIKTRFSDVWGQDSVLEHVKENMLFLEDPESVEKKGGYVPGGILLWGPPGTGKTLMAESVAGETGKPFVFVDPGAFIQMFMGVGILKVKNLFRKLRKLAVRYGGVIVFFDEADSLGSRGALAGGAPGGQPAFTDSLAHPACNGLGYVSEPTASTVFLSSVRRSEPEVAPRPGIVDRIFFGGMAGGGGMGTLNALLTELSGLKKPRGFFNRILRRALGMRPKPPPKYRILVMMATNQPNALDEALLRPGRIDRIYRVGYPSKEGRKRTYIGYLDKVNHSLTDDEIDRLATITPYATGASIKDMVNEALINAIRDERDVIEWKDMVKAKLLKSLGPPEDVEYIERERHAVAIHEACHAVAAYRKRRHTTIDIATIEKGQSYLGMVASIPLEEQFTSWSSEFEADLIVSLASLAGERIFFDGDSSSGVSGDLRNATMVAMLMEGYWGMGRTVGSHAASKAGLGRPVQGSVEDGTDRNLLETELGRRVERRLGELLDAATQLVLENRVEVLAVAHALETHKTLTGEDVEAIIEGRSGSLIDGRPYHVDEFVELAEHYHNEVLAAHKGHRKVTAALPKLDGIAVPAGIQEAGAHLDPSAD